LLLISFNQYFYLGLAIVRCFFLHGILSFSGGVSSIFDHYTKPGIEKSLFYYFIQQPCLGPTAI